MKWLLAILLAASPSVPQERADTPYSWSHFKPGTTRKGRTTTFGVSVEFHLTLKEVTDKEAVFDMITTSKSDKEGKASILRTPLFRLGEEKTGEESLKFKGVEHKCRILKGNYEFAGMKVEVKHWIAEGVDFPLKTVEVTRGAEAWMNLETESFWSALMRNSQCRGPQAEVRQDEERPRESKRARWPRGCARKSL
jgi:hypothetical protein